MDFSLISPKKYLKNYISVSHVSLSIWFCLMKLFLFSRKKNKRSIRLGFGFSPRGTAAGGDDSQPANPCLSIQSHLDPGSGCIEFGAINRCLKDQFTPNFFTIFAILFLLGNTETASLDSLCSAIGTLFLVSPKASVYIRSQLESSTSASHKKLFNYKYPLHRIYQFMRNISL